MESQPQQTSPRDPTCTVVAAKREGDRLFVLYNNGGIEVINIDNEMNQWNDGVWDGDNTTVDPEGHVWAALIGEKSKNLDVTRPNPNEVTLDTEVGHVLSRRVSNIISRKDIRKLRDLVRQTEKDLRGIIGFGDTSMSEVKFVLAEHGLRLGMIAT